MQCIFSRLWGCVECERTCTKCFQIPCYMIFTWNVLDTDYMKKVVVAWICSENVFFFTISMLAGIRFSFLSMRDIWLHNWIQQELLPYPNSALTQSKFIWTDLSSEVCVRYGRLCKYCENRTAMNIFILVDYFSATMRVHTIMKNNYNTK